MMGRQTFTTNVRTNARVAITAYKNTRKSHVGIHLWESPLSVSSNNSNKNGKRKRQIMIVHVDDHSIFASSSSSSSSSATPTTTTTTASTKPTLKVGMKLICVNGISIQERSVEDIYNILQNAIGCVTLLVGAPNFIPRSATTIIDPNELAATAAVVVSTVNATKDLTVASDNFTGWLRLPQQQQFYDRIPNMESLLYSDDEPSSSASSSFSSTTSASSSLSHYTTTTTSNNQNDIVDDEDDDDDDDESIINNLFELENKIRNIWSPILHTTNYRHKR